MFRLARKWAFLAALPLLAALTFVSSRVYVCASDGVARKACCCPEERVAATPGPSLSTACCCSHEDLVAVAVPAEPVSPKAKQLKTSSLLAELFSPAEPVLLNPVPRVFRDDRPSPAPSSIPVLLRKQSFLL